MPQPGGVAAAEAALGSLMMEVARQLDSNRRAASAGTEPATRVNWHRTGHPRPLAVATGC